MEQTRRHFLASTAAVVGSITTLNFAARAASGKGDVFKTAADDIVVHPVNHASFALKTRIGTIYVDPVGDLEKYAQLPRPDLILITHHHGDHFKPETLSGLIGDNTSLITNPEVYGKLPENLKAKASQIANGEETAFGDLNINAIPAYNTTEGREKFHPKGRDNGYVLNLDGFKIYISGDTEDIAEMRALQNIDLAFVCMNLPFTMDIAAAASAVNEFKPKFVYPYHYRGRDGGTQDPQKFAAMVGKPAEVKIGPWYG